MTCMLGFAKHEERHKSPIPCRILAGCAVLFTMTLEGIRQNDMPISTKVFFSNSFVFDVFISIGFARSRLVDVKTLTIKVRNATLVF